MRENWFLRMLSLTNAMYKPAMTGGEDRVTFRAQMSQDMSGFSHNLLQMQTRSRHIISKAATSVYTGVRQTTVKLRTTVGVTGAHEKLGVMLGQAHSPFLQP